MQSADDEVVEAASEPPAPHRRGWCRHLRASGEGGEGGGAGAAGSASGVRVRARRACRHVDRGGCRAGGGLDAPSKPLGRDLQRILQEHVRKHGNNAAEVQDLIQRVLHHRDFNANEVDHDLHERLMRAVEQGNIRAFRQISYMIS